MKYFSELLNKNFDTIEECQKAEEAENTRLAEVEKQETALANEKKQYADAIEEADKTLGIAYDNYATAKKKIQELREEYRKQVEDLRKKLEDDCREVLKPAQEEVEKAEADKLAAIQKFNQKYGSYRKVYTGSRAVEEYNRMQRTIDSLFNNLFWF